VPEQRAYDPWWLLALRGATLPWRGGTTCPIFGLEPKN
jgi:hypothetical protein